MDTALCLFSRIPGEECRDLIYELGLASQSCVCCRLSPKQKRDIVELVRGKSPGTVTLSIGDGANDVGVRGGPRTGYLIPGCDGDGAWTWPGNSSGVVVAAAVTSKRCYLVKSKSLRF